MSITVAATSNLHAQTNPIAKPFHPEPGFLHDTEDVVPCVPQLPMDSQPDLTSPSLKPDMLTNLRNPESLCAERREKGQISSIMIKRGGGESSSDMSAWQKPEEDDGLDLSLGLFSFKSTPKIVDNTSANECIANQSLERERVSTKPEHEHDGSLPRQTIEGNDQKPFPERRNDAATSHAWKPQVNGSQLTAAQIWHTIQSRSSYPEIDMLADAGREAGAFKTDLWPQLSQRSASMPFIESLGRQGSDTSTLQRATSVTSQQFVDWQPSSLVSGISRTESLQNRSISSQNHRHQEEVQELQRKKDMQAQKRQEARKRRKSLIEEKQLKRAKREESNFLLQTKGSLTNSTTTALLRTTSASVTRQDGGCSPNRDGGGLQQMGSGRLVQSWETSVRVNIAHGSADKSSERLGDVEERKRSPDCKSEGENSMQSNGDRDGDVVGRCIHQAPFVPETTTVVRRSSDGRPKATDVVGGEVGTYVSELEDARRERHLVKQTSLSEDCQSKWESSRGDLPKPIISTRSQTRVENRDGLSQNRIESDHQSTEAVASIIPLHASSAVTSSPLPYAPPPPTSFPLFPMAYPLPVPVSTSSGLPLQMSFSIPCFMQFLTPQSSSVIKEDPKSTCPQVLTPFQFPTRSELTSYRPPLSEAYSSWFAATESQAAVPQIPRTSSAKASDGSMDHDRGSSNQTQAKDVEMQILSPNSVQGSSSMKATKGHQNCFAPKPRKLHGHVSDVASQKPLPQPSLTRTLSDSAAYSMAFKSTEHVIERERSGDPFLSKAASALEKSQILPRSRAPVRECAKAVPLPDKEEKGDSMTMKGFSPQSNTGDTITSEVCNNSKHNVRSITAGNLGTEDCNTQPSLAIKGKASSTEPFRDLPRVSTTGPAPNGRTVTGVMYIFNKKYVKIVCTCHAMHMSPSEFVQHAGHTDLSNPERNILVNPFPCVC